MTSLSSEVVINLCVFIEEMSALIIYKDVPEIFPIGEIYAQVYTSSDVLQMFLKNVK